MDSLLRGASFVDFEESLDLTAPLQCLAPLTAALMMGFQLGGTDGGTVGNIEHCYVGPRHPRDFKGAKRHQLKRIIGLRFSPSLRRVFGAEMRVEQFLTQWHEDAALRRRIEAMPKWNDNLAIIDRKLRASEPAVKAGYDHRRTLLIPMRPVDAASPGGQVRAELLRLYEG